MQKSIFHTFSCANWRCQKVNDKKYTVPYQFKSYLASQITSFIEYKVNISGCVPESFMPVMKRFDTHCCSYPEKELCLKQETVMSFLPKTGIKNKTVMCLSSALRSFANYLVVVLQLSDIYVVPKKLIKRQCKTFIPYVFTEDEIIALLEAANAYEHKRKCTKTPNMVNCMPCIFTMLYCTGMRVSEISNLKLEEVDLTTRLIHINTAKNNNRRIVTISQSLAKSCKEYIEKSQNFTKSGVYFFDSGSSRNDGKVSTDLIYRYFRRFLLQVGIEHKGRGKGPRLHDIRVTFACHSLKQLSRLPGDINSHLFALSTFMGHKSIYETQDYLWLTKDLFEDTLIKMEEHTSFVTDIYLAKEEECYDE